MSRDTKIALIATIAIVASLVISAWVFGMDTKTPLAIVGGITAVSLPFYIRHRMVCNKREVTIQYHIVDDIEQTAEELEELADDIEKYNPEECEELPTEYLASVKSEITSLAEGLRNYATSLEDYNYFYNAIQAEQQQHNQWGKQSNS